MVTVNPFTTCAVVHGHVEAAHGHILFSTEFILDLIPGWCWGPGCCGYRDHGGCAAAGDLADSIAGLSQDRFIPDPAPNYGKGWAEPEHSCQERNCCIFLPRGRPRKTCVSAAPPKCAGQQPLLLLDLRPTVNALTTWAPVEDHTCHSHANDGLQGSNHITLQTPRLSLSS